MNEVLFPKAVVRPAALAVLTAFYIGLPLRAQNMPEQGKVLEFSEIKPSTEQISYKESADASAPGIAVDIRPGEAGNPGIYLKPKEGDAWDLSGYGHIEAALVNTGAEPVAVSLRVDNKGDYREKPWNSESVQLKPGESKTVKVIFGYSYGQNPGYKLNPAAVSNLLFFTGKISQESSFRIVSVKAAGPAGETPPVDPAKIRLKPKDGFVMGGGVALDPAKQVVAVGGAEAKAGPDGQGLRVGFSKKEQSVTIKSPQGLWDFRDGHQIRFKIKNTGAAPATPSVRVDSKGGSTDKASPSRPLAPGASVEIVASFIPSIPARIDDAAKPKPLTAPGTGTKFASDASTGVTLLADEAGGAQAFEVELIRVEAPPAEMPDWLGKRPPVEGDWVPTFQEEFEGDAVNFQRWNIYGSNFWDKKTHFSKDNVIVKDGLARLRCEKKTGRHNDDPAARETDYATGFLDTYGKWVQRYGYFEARMKLPEAPGMWPAFWLMPDRGLAAGEQWKRADTANGGMEFDIMEFLSRWGPYRFSPAFHWDGYGKEHKATGAGVYTAHDKDGFITTGLLWLPGLMVVYNNGKEVVRWESPRISNVPSDIMFTNVTGGWDNSPLDASKLPADLVIDYVRCWQRKDLASEADGVKSTQASPSAPAAADPPPR